MIVRRAETADLRQFDLLWGEYLEECQKRGDTTKNTRNNREFFRKVARHYMTNPELGIVAMAFDHHVPAGVVMWGAFIGAMPVQTTLGQVANGWGSYVRPAYRGEGLSRKLREFAASHLVAVGADTLLGSVNAGEEAALKSVLNMGFVPRQLVVSLDLRKIRASDSLSDGHPEPLAAEDEGGVDLGT